MHKSRVGWVQGGWGVVCAGGAKKVTNPGGDLLDGGSSIAPPTAVFQSDICFVCQLTAPAVCAGATTDATIFYNFLWKIKLFLFRLSLIIVSVSVCNVKRLRFVCSCCTTFLVRFLEIVFIVWSSFWSQLCSSSLSQGYNVGSSAFCQRGMWIGINTLKIWQLFRRSFLPLPDRNRTLICTKWATD